MTADRGFARCAPSCFRDPTCHRISMHVKAPNLVGKEIVGEDVISMHAEDLMGKRHDQPSAILSPSAMDKQGTSGCRERLKKTRIQIDIRTFEWQPRIEVSKIVSNRRCTQIAIAEKDSPRIVAGMIASDHPTAVGPGTGRMSPALVSSTEVDNNRDAQCRYLLDIPPAWHLQGEPIETEFRCGPSSRPV